MIFCRANFAATLGYDGKLYIAGGVGSKGEILAGCERYDWKKSKWEVLQPMHQARQAFGMLGMPDGIYVLGGTTTTNNNGGSKAVERFSY